MFLLSLGKTLFPHTGLFFFTALFSCRWDYFEFTTFWDTIWVLRRVGFFSTFLGRGTAVGGRFDNVYQN